MQESAHFTIDFVEEQYRDSINSLVEILCVDLKEAYDLFIMSGCNLEAAINRKTNPQHQHSLHSSFLNQNPSRQRRNNVSHQAYHHQLQQIHSYSDEDEDYVSHSITRRRRPVPLRVEEECQFDVKFNKFLQVQRQKKTFKQNYKIRRQYTTESNASIGMRICMLFNKLVDKKPKKIQKKTLLELKPFYKQVEKSLLRKRCEIFFDKGSMSQCLQKSFNSSKALLLYNLNFDKQQPKQEKNRTKNHQTRKGEIRKKAVLDITDDRSNEKLVQLEGHKDQQFLESKKNLFFKTLLLDSKTAKLVNEGFENYILDVDAYDYEVYFMQFLPKSTRKQNFLLVLRVNVLQQIEVVGRVDLDQCINKINQKQGDDFEQYNNAIRQQLKKLQQKIKRICKEQLEIKQRYRLLQLGIDHFEYIKPPTTAEKRKIKEDQELIRKQQEEFMSIQNEMLQQRMKQLEKSDQENEGKLSKEEILQKRKSIRDNLKTYTGGEPNVMTIKLRLPSGKNVILSVSPQEKAQYLFDYVFSLETQNIGFQEEQQGGYCERKFDIIRPEDRTGLQTKTNLSLEDIFEGSTMQSLIVKQK